MSLTLRFDCKLNFIQIFIRIYQFSKNYNFLRPPRGSQLSHQQRREGGTPESPPPRNRKNCCRNLALSSRGIYSSAQKEATKFSTFQTNTIKTISFASSKWLPMLRNKILKKFENQRSLLNYCNKFIKIKSAREKLVENRKDLISPLNSSPPKTPTRWSGLETVRNI